jgi:hypothetical protein
MTLLENLNYLGTVGYPILTKSYVGTNWLINIKLLEATDSHEHLFTKRGVNPELIVNQLVDDIKLYLSKK